MADSPGTSTRLPSGRDVARLAGVSQATVSIALAHPNSKRVSAATRERIVQIADEIGYRPQRAGRQLRTGRTGLVLLAVPDVRSAFFARVLHGAQAAATAAVRPGVACEAIDRAARAPIEAEGFGEAFFHRTGHGIGLEGHEDPYLVDGNTRPLEPGMAFSVEPGIYLTDAYGARIEDIVVCGEDGPLTLNRAPRELYIVDG